MTIINKKNEGWVTALCLASLFLIVGVGIYFAPKQPTKIKSSLPNGTKVEIIDGHEYLVTYSNPILSSRHVASRVHKADCKFCKTH